MIASFVSALVILVPVQSPLLKFSKGEVIRYKTTMSGSRSASFKGDTQSLTFTAGCSMSLNVTSASPARATMRVAYSGATANATAIALPPNLRSKKADFEKSTAEALKKSMLEGGRSQTVTSRGLTTFTIPLGDGKSMTISDGAFMMLVLPQGALAAGKTWTANVRMPIPEASGSLKVTYKNAGVVSYANQQAQKITFSAGDSKSQTQGEVTAKMSNSLTGHVILGIASGKVLYGEIKRDAITTLTHKKEGTRTGKQTSVQTFTKL